MDKTIETTKNMLLDEIDKITAKGQLTMADLEALHKLSETMYYLCKSDSGSGGYSMDGQETYTGPDMYSRTDRSGRRGTSYGRGYDYPPARY